MNQFQVPSLAINFIVIVTPFKKLVFKKKRECKL